MKSLNQVWELANLPPNKKAISCKWVFKTKTNGKDRVCNYKVRLVAKGFSQSYRKDYDKTFAPVVKYDTIRALLCVAHKGLNVRHLDVKSAYLNEELEEEIWNNRQIFRSADTNPRF